MCLRVSALCFLKQPLASTGAASLFPYLSLSPPATCPGSILSASHLARGLFDPVGFADSLQPLVDLYRLVFFNEKSYRINKRRPCFDWLKWHHSGISVTVIKKDVGEKGELDKWMSGKTDEETASLFLLYILLSWTAALRNLFFLSPSPQEAFCKQHVLHSSLISEAGEREK